MGVTALTVSVSIWGYPSLAGQFTEASGRPGARFQSVPRRNPMLWTIFVILLILWLIGVVTANTFGGFIHILLVIAIVIVLIRVISGRRPL
jgi:dipeptide/tripeptide permease